MKHLSTKFFLVAILCIPKNNIYAKEDSSKQIDKTFTIEKDITFSTLKEDLPIYDDKITFFNIDEYLSIFDFDDLNVEVDILDIEYNPKKIFLNKKKHRAYAKVGYTTSPSPILEAFFGDKCNNKLLYNAKVKHSSRGVEWDHYNEYKNTINLNGIYLFEDFFLGSKVDIGFHKVSTPIVDSKKFEENFPKTFEIKLFGRNFYEENLFYKAEMTYDYASLNDNLYEHLCKLNGAFEYDINQTNTLSVTSEIAFGNYSTKFTDLNRYSLFLQGVNKTTIGNWQFDYGVILIFNNDQKNEDKFQKAKDFKKDNSTLNNSIPFENFIPNAKVKYNFEKGTVVLSFLKFDYKSNSIKDLFERYRYLSSEEIHNFSSRDLFCSLGVEYKISKNINLNGDFKGFLDSNNYSAVNHIFLKKSPAYLKVAKKREGAYGVNFDIIYNDEAMKNILTLSFKSIIIPRHIQSIILSLVFASKLSDKILLRSEFCFAVERVSLYNSIESMLHLEISGKSNKKLHNIIDLSISMDYIINEDWAAFVALDNVFMQRAKNTHPLDKSGIKISAGVRYMFL